MINYVKPRCQLTRSGKTSPAIIPPSVSVSDMLLELDIFNGEWAEGMVNAFIW